LYCIELYFCIQSLIKCCHFNNYHYVWCQGLWC